MIASKVTRRSFLTASSGLAVAALTPIKVSAASSDSELTEFTATVTIGKQGNITAMSASNYWLYSPKLSSKYRFDLIGFNLGKQSGKIEMRTKRRKHSWSEWIPVTSHTDHRPDSGKSKQWSDPVWVEGADYLQVRSTKPLDRLKIKLINSTNTATAAGRSANTITALAVASPKPKYRAKGIRPAIFKRKQWATSSLKPRTTPSYGSVNLAFVHHTVSANGYKKSSSLAMVRAIGQYHRNSNGWNDVGYNFLIDQYGQIFEGRSGGIEREVIGAQAQGFNAVSTGIAVIGTFGSRGVSTETLNALADLITWKFAVHGIPFKGRAKVQSAGGSLSRFSSGKEARLNRISGHRDGGKTECPGGSLYKQLPQLRQMVIERSQQLPQLTIKALVAESSYGKPVPLQGQLTSPDGTPITGANVRLRRLGSKGFWTTAKLTTDSKGNWSTELSPRSSSVVQAVYVDESGSPLAYSPRTRLSVLSELTLAADKTTVASGERVILSGTVLPESAAVTLTAERFDSSGKSRKVSRKKPVVTRGSFKRSYRLTKPGTYNFTATTGTDSKNPTGQSPVVTVTVT